MLNVHDSAAGDLVLGKGDGVSDRSDGVAAVAAGAKAARAAGKQGKVRPSRGVQPCAALLQAIAASADAMDGRQGKAHLWHGAEVVRAALEEGGEAALQEVATR